MSENIRNAIAIAAIIVAGLFIFFTLMEDYSRVRDDLSEIERAVPAGVDGNDSYEIERVTQLGLSQSYSPHINEIGV